MTRNCCEYRRRANFNYNLQWTCEMFLFGDIGSRSYACALRIWSGSLQWHLSKYCHL